MNYFHLIFTVPEVIAKLIQSHQRVLFDILFQAAWDALQTLAADPKYVSGRIGMMVMLHTWSLFLRFHPHLHCLVPAGGLTYLESQKVSVLDVLKRILHTSGSFDIADFV